MRNISFVLLLASAACIGGVEQTGASDGSENTGVNVDALAIARAVAQAKVEALKQAVENYNARAQNANPANPEQQRELQLELQNLQNQIQQLPPGVQQGLQMLK